MGAKHRSRRKLIRAYGEKLPGTVLGCSGKSSTACFVAIAEYTFCIKMAFLTMSVKLQTFRGVFGTIKMIGYLVIDCGELFPPIRFVLIAEFTVRVPKLGYPPHERDSQDRHRGE
jgi:hypothetical protein